MNPSKTSQANIHFIDAFHQKLIKIWYADTIPIKWNQNNICHIHKKGTLYNIRTIQVSVFLKSFLRSWYILYERLKHHVKPHQITWFLPTTLKENMPAQKVIIIIIEVKKFCDSMNLVRDLSNKEISGRS